MKGHEKVLADELASVALFSNVDAKYLKRIAKQISLSTFAKGEPVIVAENDRPVRHGRMFIILEGTAAVVKDGAVVASLGPGDHFGEMALLDGGPRSADVVATSPLTAGALASWNFAAIMKEEPEIALSVIGELVARLRTIDEAV